MKRILIFACVVSFFALLGRTALAAPAADLSTKFTRLAFKGTAQSPEVYGASYPIVSLNASGSGIATELGQFTLVYKGEINLADLSTVETAQFAWPNGNRIDVTGVGQAIETARPGIYNLVQIYKVTGGSGRFIGAKGTITVNRIVNMASGLTYSTFDGYLLVASQ
ncbi:MAG TPA: hypothetical protein VK909_21675 [Anaerolineales bacterium]|nr:hypothetical protein [Anaerolineales bacterium]